MKKKIIAIVVIVLIIVTAFLISTGFRERTDVVLVDYTVSEDGTEITFVVGVSSSMGYIRGYKDEGGGVKPHYLKFYSTFGGLNSSLGAKSEFTLELDENDTEIFFCRLDGGYEIVLVKADGTNEWIRPERGGSKYVVDAASEAENTLNVSGTELSEGSITFEVNAQIDEIQMTDISILTNTTEITISVEDIMDGVVILLFLYKAESPVNPILYATLTDENTSVDFTNLTSACAYKVGAEIKNADQSVTLTITD